MAGEDPDYLAWVRRQPCAVAERGDCFGKVAPHHATHGRGLGQRTHDHTAVPLCAGHHDAFHDGHPPFAAMGKDGRAEWMDEMAREHRALYERQMSRTDY